MMREYFRIAMRNLRKRKLRSWLTMLGIIIGITAIVSLFFLGQGLQNAISAEFASMGSRQLLIAPKGLNGPPIEAKGLKIDDAEALESIAEFDYVNPLLMQFGTVKYKNFEVQTIIKGIPQEDADKRFADMNIELLKGQQLSDVGKYSAVIGYKTATKMFNEKEIRVGNSIEIEGVKFRVVGIMKESGSQSQDNDINIPFEAAREVFNTGQDANVIVATVKEGIELDVPRRKAERILDKKLGEDEYRIVTPEEIARQINSVLGIVQIIIVGISAISLFVGALGIMNVMFTSVLERTREIGIMKAIGARNIDVLMLFMFESGLMGLAGGIVGVILGSLVAYGVGVAAKAADITLLKVQIEPVVILVSLAIAFFLGMIFGVIPAYRAARLKPVDALRYE